MTETEPIDVEATLREHLTECAALRVETNRKLGDLDKGHQIILARLDGFNRSAWKAVGSIALAIFVAALGLFVQGYQAHQEATQHTDNAAATVVRYSAADAARDRAEQEAVNRQILDQLGKLSRSRR